MHHLQGAAIDRILGEVVHSKSIITPTDYVLCISHFLGKKSTPKLVFTLLFYCFIHLIEYFGLSTYAKHYSSHQNYVLDWSLDVFSHKLAAAQKLTSQLNFQILMFTYQKRKTHGATEAMTYTRASPWMP